MNIHTLTWKHVTKLKEIKADNSDCLMRNKKKIIQTTNIVHQTIYNKSSNNI